MVKLLSTRTLRTISLRLSNQLSPLLMSSQALSPLPTRCFKADSSLTPIPTDIDLALIMIRFPSTAHTELVLPTIREMAPQQLMATRVADLTTSLTHMEAQLKIPLRSKLNLLSQGLPADTLISTPTMTTSSLEFSSERS